MTNRITLVLQEFADKHQLGEVEFNEDNAVSMNYAEDMDIHCQIDQSGDWLTLYSYVTLVDEEIDTKSLLFMLNANNFGTLTRGYTLSVSPSSHHAMLHMCLPGSFIDIETFEWFTGQLANATLEWREFVRVSQGEAEPYLSTGEQAMPQDFLMQRV